MQGPLRKIVHASLFELFAIAITTAAFSWISGHGTAHTSALAVFSSVVALLWNMAYNAAFERWERRQTVRGRSVARRVVHALGFEAGLVVLLVPPIAWWLDMTLWDALIADIGLVLFFLAYGFAFNWAFDRVFGLPAAAR